jgi:hypothetical protein
VTGIGVSRSQKVPLGAIFGGFTLLGCLATGLLGLDHLPFKVCAFKAATGLPCLTCGTTRALGRLYALDLPGAFAMNPLAAAVALALLLWGILDLALLPEKRFVGLELSGWAARVARGGAVMLLVANWAYLMAVGR